MGKAFLNERYIVVILYYKALISFHRKNDYDEDDFVDGIEVVKYIEGGEGIPFFFKERSKRKTKRRLI